MQEDKTDIEAAIQFAKRYLEDILSFFGLNTQVYATTEDDVIELNVPSTHLNGFLIGQRGDTMRALQFMTSNALKNSGYSHNRVNVDVADYKKQRSNRLAQTAETWIQQVVETGKPMHLKPMNAADRRTIHKLASEHDLVTESEGEGYERHVVLKPAAAKSGKQPAKQASNGDPSTDDDQESPQPAGTENQSQEA